MHHIPSTLRGPAAAGLALAVLALSGCVPMTPEARAQSGDSNEQIALWAQYDKRLPNGKRTDGAKAEHWFDVYSQHNLEYRGLYAEFLMRGHFDRFDEVRAMAAAQQAPQDNSFAKSIIDDVHKLKEAEAKEFASLQQLYAEARPLCPDHYLKSVSAVDARLIDSADAGFSLLPDTLAADDPNRHAYLRLVSTCPFLLAEHLKDPQAYAVLADWYAGPSLNDQDSADAIRAVALKRLPPAPAAPAAKPVPVNPEKVANVRAWMLGRFHVLYAAKLTDAQKTRSADCYQAALQMNDFMRAKQYTEAAASGQGALTTACADGYGHAYIGVLVATSQFEAGSYAAATKQALDTLQGGGYDDVIEAQLIKIVEGGMVKQKSWGDFDAMVKVLKDRFHDLDGMDF
jgi:hypothetical protein